MESETSYTYMSGVRGKVSTHCLGQHIGDPTKDLNSYNFIRMKRLGSTLIQPAKFLLLRTGLRQMANELTYFYS